MEGAIVECASYNPICPVSIVVPARRRRTPERSTHRRSRKTKPRHPSFLTFDHVKIFWNNFASCHLWVTSTSQMNHTHPWSPTYIVTGSQRLRHSGPKTYIERARYRETAIDGRTNGRTDGRTDERTDGRTYTHTRARTHAETHRDP
jgi:hypothetical protein